MSLTSINMGLRGGDSPHNLEPAVIRPHEDRSSISLLPERGICYKWSYYLPVDEPVVSTIAIQSPLLRLPYELRRIVFSRSIMASRVPRPEDVHGGNLNAHWKDHPSPLLSTNRQIREEVKDMLRRKKLLSMRVTSAGANSDMYGLSCIIAQNLRSDLSDLPGLAVEIWPPHPDRPVEMFYLHEHLRTLRRKLCVVPLIPKLIIHFVELKPVKWAVDGEPRSTLFHLDEFMRCDMTIILDHFARLTNVELGDIRLPPSLRANLPIKYFAIRVLERMETGLMDDEPECLADPDDPRGDDPLLEIAEEWLLTHPKSTVKDTMAVMHARWVEQERGYSR